MTEGDFLDEAFSEPSNEPAETVETVEAAPEPAVVRDDKGRFAPKGETESASPAPAEEEAPFDHAAVKGERKRRQEAEARLAALEAQLQSLQQPQEPAAPPPSIWDDEQGWQQHFGGQVSQQATLNATLNTSEMLCRDKFDDFDEMKAKFLEMANQNPAIAQQALTDPHPWRKAYTVAKNAAKMEALGATDVSELEAKIEARIRAELEAKQPEPVAIPTTLADHQSARGGHAPAQTGPLTIEDILGRR